MQQFIVSDIFGKTKELEDLASELSGDIDIIDPYNSKFMAFESEDNAYSYFTGKVGLEAYTEKLFNTVSSQNRPVRLLGFSVGASAIWKLSCNPKAGNIISAVLFYSSQIRFYTEIDPLFPTTIIFPEAEKHFSVTKIISNLSGKENVQVYKSNYQHGFMNFHSKNYNAVAYNKYKHALCNEFFCKDRHYNSFIK